MKRKLHIFEFPSNLGLKQLADREPGVARLTARLREVGLHEALHPAAVTTLPGLPYTMDLDPATGIRNAPAIRSYALQQAAVLADPLQAGTFCFIIGGDCSILIGSALALRRLANCALFFLDGHTDFVTPEASATGGAAGMDLALVTGHGPALLSSINGLGPYFQENLTWCVGNRYFDAEYLAPMEKSGMTYLDLPGLREMGITVCASAFIDFVTEKQAQRFFIHLDADVLDNLLMPAVDSPQEGGLRYDELEELLVTLIADPRCAGIEVTILDPDLDPEKKYSKAFAEVLVHIMHSAGLVSDQQTVKF
ncbi:arginase family protein [Pedobacter sp. SYP-B3415]|uniref:arginase family protein n=1 Tax=Pedobacter sp. SYP-B3415 TaxID=2496641 RepID=UPI00101BBC15|nr:arginase family protein [Pedobacter sp. SYP-B3415]